MPEAAFKKGWTQGAFGDVVRLCRDRSSDPEGDGFERYVGLEHIDPGDLKIRRWGDIADGTTFTSVFRSGQVLFGKRRAYQRKVAVADFDGVCSGDIYVLEPENSRLLPQLLPFICQTDGFFEHAVGTSAGSLSPRTNWDSLASYELVLPPLEEQRRIATVLGAMEVAGEALRDAKRSVQVMRTAHLNDFFEPRFRTGVPLTTVARVVAGGTPSRADPTLWGGGRPWASGKDLKTRHLKDTEDTLTEKGWALATVAPRGATLIVVRGMILAHTFPVARCEQDIAFNQDLRALIAGDQLEPDYLLLWTEWAARWFLRCTAASSHGTRRIEGRVFDQVPVPIPSRDEQLRFVVEHAAIIKAYAGLGLRQASHHALRQSFMKTVLEGPR